MSARQLTIALALGLAAAALVGQAAGSAEPAPPTTVPTGAAVGPTTTLATPTTTPPTTAPASTPPASNPEATLDVEDHGEYLAALAAYSTDDSGPHTIVITDHFDFATGIDPTYTGTQPLTIEGNDFTHALGHANRFLVFDSDAELTIRDLWVSEGRAHFRGAFRSDGGAIDYRGTGGLQIVSSAFDRNEAAARGGAVAALHAPVMIDASSFTSNRADQGGGLAVAEGLVTNSTVARNRAGRGGGVHVSAGAGHVGLVHVTLAENRSSRGANVSSNRSGAASLIATALVDPDGGGRNCALPDGPVNDLHSFADDPSCRLGATSITDGDGSDPLGPLAGDGATEVAMAPLADGPLVDAVPTDVAYSGIAASCAALDDQREVPRPQEGDGLRPAWCDIGAIELEGRLAPRPGGPLPAAPPFTG